MRTVPPVRLSPQPPRSTLHWPLLLTWVGILAFCGLVWYAVIRLALG